MSIAMLVGRRLGWGWRFCFAFLFVFFLRLISTFVQHQPWRETLMSSLLVSLVGGGTLALLLSSMKGLAPKQKWWRFCADTAALAFVLLLSWNIFSDRQNTSLTVVRALLGAIFDGVPTGLTLCWVLPPLMEGSAFIDRMQSK